MPNRQELIIKYEEQELIIKYEESGYIVFSSNSREDAIEEFKDEYPGVRIVDVKTLINLAKNYSGLYAIKGI